MATLGNIIARNFNLEISEIDDDIFDQLVYFNNKKSSLSKEDKEDFLLNVN